MQKPGNIVAMVVLSLILGGTLVACEKKGPVEQVAEEVDEAIDTARNGKESLENKVDDAVDEIRK